MLDKLDPKSTIVKSKFESGEPWTRAACLRDTELSWTTISVPSSTLKQTRMIHSFVQLKYQWNTSYLPIINTLFEFKEICCSFLSDWNSTQEKLECSNKTKQNKKTVGEKWAITTETPVFGWIFTPKKKRKRHLWYKFTNN